MLPDNLTLELGKRELDGKPCKDKKNKLFDSAFKVVFEFDEYVPVERSTSFVDLPQCAGDSVGTAVPSSPGSPSSDKSSAVASATPNGSGGVMKSTEKSSSPGPLRKKVFTRVRSMYVGEHPRAESNVSGFADIDDIGDDFEDEEYEHEEADGDEEDEDGVEEPGSSNVENGM